MEDERTQAIKQEMTQVREAIAPRMAEYFDAWGIVATRAGTGELMLLFQGQDEDTIAELENAVLAAASEILRERAEQG